MSWQDWLSSGRAKKAGIKRPQHAALDAWPTGDEKLGTAQIPGLSRSMCVSARNPVEFSDAQEPQERQAAFPSLSPRRYIRLSEQHANLKFRVSPGAVFVTERRAATKLMKLASDTFNGHKRDL